MYIFKDAINHVIKCAQHTKVVRFTKISNDRIRCNICGQIILAESCIPTYSKSAVGM